MTNRPEAVVVFTEIERALSTSGGASITITGFIHFTQGIFFPMYLMRTFMVAPQSPHSTVTRSSAERVPLAADELAAGTEAAQQSTRERGAPIARTGPEVKAMSSKLGITDEESAKFLDFLGKNPDAAPYETLLGGQ